MSTEKIYEKKDTVEHPRAGVLITHGLGEHLHRYDHWVQHLNSAGISTFRYDLPGHGRTRKKEWLFQNFGILTEAIQKQYDEAAEYCVRNHIPLFLFGHSLGGLITAGFVTDSQPEARGVILSAPAMDPGDLVSPILKRLAGMAQKILPGLPVLKLPPEKVSEDPAVVQAYTEDPLVYTGKIKARPGYEMLVRMEEVRSRAEKFDLPLLMLHGSGDEIIRPEKTKSYFEMISAEDKTYTLFPGVYHELLNSFQKEEVMHRILTWIEDRV